MDIHASRPARRPVSDATTAAAIERKLNLAFQSTTAEGRYDFGYAFGLFVAEHPTDSRSGPVWWVQTAGGERLPLSVELLRCLDDEDLAVSIYGRLLACLATGPYQGAEPLMSQLVIYQMIMPRGVGQGDEDYCDIEARLNAREYAERPPIICLVRGGRPTGWPA